MLETHFHCTLEKPVNKESEIGAYNGYEEIMKEAVQISHESSKL